VIRVPKLNKRKRLTEYNKKRKNNITFKIHLLRNIFEIITIVYANKKGKKKTTGILVPLWLRLNFCKTGAPSYSKINVSR